ncbi:MAG: Mycothiol conjugate amidase Mca [Acidimicrobiaceae bacterium]|nr:Mycothiol conjugate amidase Mca [Acidimicrobiaceae bacterium]
MGLCLMTVHAHPDDEASKGAGTVARYHAAGVRTVLVTCTGGEEGDILNPAMDRPEVRAELPAVRRQELADAAGAIGYDEVVLLGYRDSGMPDSPANADPRSFHQAPIAEAVGRLVEVIRRERPQVIVTYPEDQSGYPHPDHIRVHEITVAAFEAAGDPAAYPGLGEPYQPLKLYYSLWPVEQMVKRHEKFLELGLDSPYTELIKEGWLERAPVQEPTAKVDIAGFADARRAGLLAHATQIDPASPHWFGLPVEHEREIHVNDPYVLARSLVVVDGPEDDLFSSVPQALAELEGTRAGSPSSSKRSALASEEIGADRATGR